MFSEDELIKRVFDWFVDECSSIIDSANVLVNHLKNADEPLPRKVLSFFEEHMKKLSGGIYDEESMTFGGAETINDIQEIVRDDVKSTFSRGYFEKYVLKRLEIDPDVDNFEDALYDVQTDFYERYVKIRNHHLQQAEKLLDHVKELHNAEAPEDADWGQFAFGEDRIDTPCEADTDEEKQVGVALAKHVHNNAHLSSDNAKKIQDLIKKNEYTKLLKLDTQKYPVLYRGMSIGKDTLEGLLQTSDIVPGKSYRGHFVAKPKAHTASWTIDYTEAVKFAYETRSDYRIVLFARASDNPEKFILNPETIYNVDFLRSFSIEKETIGVGPITAFEIEVLPERSTRRKKKDVMQTTGE